MRCPYCHTALIYVRGHATCGKGGCPLFGVNQAECCSGETAACGPLTVDVWGAAPQHSEAARRSPEEE